MSTLAEIRFRCPGEDYFIDRSIHLARLAAGFSACQACRHRFDAAGSPAVISLPAVDATAIDVDKAATKALAAARASALVGSEGPLGIARNEIDAAWVRRFGLAFGAAVTASLASAGPGSAGPAPRIAVAGDGRALTAELVAAASEGLGWAGCRVVEVGAASVGMLSLAIVRHGLDGGLLLGNSSGASQMVSLKCWGSTGEPWSVGGQLDRVLAAHDVSSPRTSRRSGGRERVSLSADDRLLYADLFHGLRPLRFVLDAASAPLVEAIRLLTAGSACQMLPPRLPAAGALAAKADRKARPVAGARSAASATIANYRSRRVGWLCEHVPSAGADFGLWIDGDGDLAELVDERGRPVNPERLLLTWARRLPAADRKAGVVLESDASLSVRAQLAAAGIRVIESSPTREAMHAALLASGAACGGGPSGRLWVGGDFPQSDALQVVGLLLQLLSQADRPLSEVLAGAD